MLLHEGPQHLGHEVGESFGLPVDLLGQRGGVALVSLQAQQNPELQQLASAITVATEANKVLVSARIPYGLIDALQPAAKPAAPAAAAPQAAPAR